MNHVELELESGKAISIDADKVALVQSMSRDTALLHFAGVDEPILVVGDRRRVILKLGWIHEKVDRF